MLFILPMRALGKSSRPSCVSEVRRQDLGQQLEFNGTSDVSQKAINDGSDRLHCSIMRRSFHCLARMP